MRASEGLQPDDFALHWRLGGQAIALEYHRFIQNPAPIVPSSTLQTQPRAPTGRIYSRFEQEEAQADLQAVQTRQVRRGPREEPQNHEPQPHRQPSAIERDEGDGEEALQVPPAPRRRQKQCSACRQYGHTARNHDCRRRREQSRIDEENRQREDTNRRIEEEGRRREEARQRCLQKIMVMIQQEREGRNVDDLPPSPGVALETAGQQHEADLREMEEEFQRMERGQGRLSPEDVGRLDFIVATARTRTEVQVKNTEEASFQAMRRQTEAAYESWRREREDEAEERRRSNAESIELLRRSGDEWERRQSVMTEDVLEEILSRYRQERLNLTARTDPTHHDDPLYPFVTWNPRAKAIVREVVLEKKGELGKEILKEVDELEQRVLAIRPSEVASEVETVAR